MIFIRTTGFIGFLVQISPITITLSIIFYILSALVIKAVKVKYQV